MELKNATVLIVDDERMLLDIFWGPCAKRTCRAQ
jgi:hypothetical protein